MTTWAETWPGIEVSVEWSPTTDPWDTPVWVSMSNDIRSWRCKRGRSHELDRPQTGSLNAVADNRARQYDSTYDAGTYFGDIIPNRRVRVQMRYNNVVYDVWAGFLDAIDPAYLPGTTDAVANIAASGIFKMLALKKLWASMVEFSIRAYGPKHWWRLNESADPTRVIDSGWDPTGDGYVLGNTITFGSAGFLAAYDNNLTCPDFVDGEIRLPPRLIAGDTNFTLTAWFIVPTAPTPGVGTDNMYIVDLGASLGTGLGFWMSRESGRAGCVQMFGPGDLGDSYPTSLADNLPHHLAVTGAGDGNALTFYIDGVPVETGVQGAPTALDEGYYNRIGDSTIATPGISSGGGDPFVGKIAEVAYYDECLSGDEILFQYRCGSVGGWGDDTGSRVERLLSAVGVPSSDYNVTTPGISLVGTHNLSSTMTCVEYLMRLAETEQGNCYEDDDGILIFGSRQERLTATKAIEVQVWFGHDFSYREVDFTLDDALWFTEARVSRDGGTEQHIEAPAAVMARAGGVSTYSKTGLLYSSDNECIDHGNFVIGHYSEPRLRAREIKVYPLQNPSVAIPAVLSLKIGDRVEITRNVPGGGDPIEPELVVEGIEHEVNQRHEWTVTIVGSPAEALRFWILDDADNSLLDDSTRLSF